MTNGMFYKSKEARKKAFRAFCDAKRRCEVDGCEAFDTFQDIAEEYDLKNPSCIDVWEHLPASVSAKEGETK